jgi:hypothetical protein
LAAINAAQYSA